jgi:hypothetical protein
LPDGKKHVFDADNQRLGSVDTGGTFDKNGRLVSRTPMEGLLFNRTGKKGK